jgi:hypothetical protein
VNSFSALELILIHMELECIGVNENGDLYQFQCADPDDLPRFYVAHHEHGYSRYFQQDLPDYIRDQLLALTPDVALRDTGIVRAILAQDAPCHDFYTGKSYIFPDSIPPHLFADAVRLDESHRPLMEQSSAGMQITDKAVFAIITDGQIVSTCESSRENEHAGEAWVQTLPPYRGRGYARQVTAAWANYIQQQGKTAFYSHKLSNSASQHVAQRLGLIQYIADAGYV